MHCGRPLPRTGVIYPVLVLLATRFERAEALHQFQASNVNPYVYGMALLEIGVAAMVKVGEVENDILETVRKLDAKIRPGMVE